MLIIAVGKEHPNEENPSTISINLMYFGHPRDGGMTENPPFH